MRMMMCVVLLLPLAACEIIVEGKETGETADPGIDTGEADTDTDTDADADSDTDTDTDADTDVPVEPPTWTTYAGPCSGYRTETLVFDADGSAWAGCGADVGLFYAATTGAWVSVNDHDQFHCFDAHLADDGLLYIAGDDTTSDDLAYRGDPAQGDLYDGTPIFFYGMSINSVALAGTILRAPDGTIVVDAENSYQYGLSLDDGDSFTEEYFSTYQWMDTDLASDGKIYASGSTIAHPPIIVLPGAKPGDFFAIEIGDGDFTGELFGIAAIDADRIFAVGVDEPTHHAMFARCTGACTSPASWTVEDLTDSVELGQPADLGRLHAIRFDESGTYGMAVGERYPQALGGWAMYTTDRGDTWKMADDPGFPILTQVWSFGDGTFAVAGGGGYMAVSLALP